MIMFIKRWSIFQLLFLSFLVLSALTSSAATITWTGNTSSDWNIASNWNPTNVPTSSDDVTIPSGRTNYPYISYTATNTVKKITVDGLLTIDSGGNLSATGDIKTNSGGEIKTPGGLITTTKSFDVKGNVVANGGTISCKDYKGSGTMNMTAGLFQVSHDYKPDIPENFTTSGGTVHFTGNAGGMGFKNSGTYSFWNVIVDVADPNFQKNNDNIISIGNNLALYAAIELPTNDAATAKTLTLGAGNKGVGTWGSSTSGSSNVDNTYFVGNGFITINTALPIQLIEFGGKRINDKIELFWSTASELNNEKFVLERSEDGNTFRPIHESLSQGNSSTERSYNYTDNNAIIGINYYRLLQVDFDGSKSYSTIVAVMVKQIFNTFITYPNPVSETLTLKSNLQETVKFTIYNREGKSVSSLKASFQFGEASLDVSYLQNGVYLLRSDDGRFNEKILVQR